LTQVGSFCLPPPAVDDDADRARSPHDFPDGFAAAGQQTGIGSEPMK